MAQFLRPDSNVTQSGFTGGFAEIDEAVASDADRANGANNTAAVLEVGLSNASAPGAGATTVRYRHAKVNNGALDAGGNAVTVTAEVVQGNTVIATDAAQNTGAPATRSWTPDLSAINDWADVRLRFTTSASGGSPANRRGAAITWAELEVPDAPASTPGRIKAFIAAAWVEKPVKEFDGADWVEKPVKVFDGADWVLS